MIKYITSLFGIKDSTECIRVGYDLYECCCKECINLDMTREKNNEKK